MSLAVRVLCLAMSVSLACAVFAQDKASGTSHEARESPATAQHPPGTACVVATGAEAEADACAGAGERASLTPDDDAAHARREEKAAERSPGAQPDSMLLLLLQLLRSPK